MEDGASRAELLDLIEDVLQEEDPLFRQTKWNKVHDAAANILDRGLFKPNGDADTLMQKQQRKRSLLLKQRIDQK